MRAPRVRGPLAAAGAMALLALVALGARGASGEEDWSLPGLAGGALTSKDVASGNAIVVVWASWAPQCRNIVERSNAIVEKWNGRARVVLVDFQEDPADVTRFFGGKTPRAPVYLDADGAFAKQHQVTTLPSLVVYRDGAFANLGQLPDDPDSVLSQQLH